MANNLPPGVLPKLWRQRNKGGNEVGAWYITIKKKAVNLRTQVYAVARERAREVYFAGKDAKTFQDERFMEQPAPKTDGMPAPVEGQPQPSGDWTSDVADAAANGLSPDAYTSPQGKETPLLTAIPRTSEDEPKPETPKVDEASEDSTKIPPEMLEGLVKQLAMMLVEGQIAGQQWLAIRFGKFEPGAISAADISPSIHPAKLWESQIRKWLPTDVPVPEWLAAIILTGMVTIPVQLANAKPLKKEKSESEPAQAPVMG